MVNIGLPFKKVAEKTKYALELKFSAGGRSKKELVLSHEFTTREFKFNYPIPLAPATYIRGLWLVPLSQPLHFEANVTRSTTDGISRFFEVTAQFISPPAA